LDKSGQVLTKPTPTNLNYFRPVWTSLDKSRPEFQPIVVKKAIKKKDKKRRCWLLQSRFSSPNFTTFASVSGSGRTLVASVLHYVL
jgi:hypothetical protein